MSVWVHTQGQIQNNQDDDLGGHGTAEGVQLSTGCSLVASGWVLSLVTSIAYCNSMGEDEVDRIPLTGPVATTLGLNRIHENKTLMAVSKVVFAPIILVESHI